MASELRRRENHDFHRAENPSAGVVMSGPIPSRNRNASLTAAFSRIKSFVAVSGSLNGRAENQSAQLW